jgi:RHH-type rel operon transcriptional repressor/antitoxin RelB
MPTSIRLPPAIEKRLSSLATKTGRSKAFYLREIIDRGLEDAEDTYLAAKVLDRVRSGKEKVFTLAEVEKSLGMAD